MRSLLFFTTLIPIRLIAQQDTILIIYPTEPQTNDTIFINGSMDGHILFGTMALPLTSSQTALWSYSGLWLTSVKGSDCNGHDEDKMGIDKIESIWISDSSWIFSTLESDSIINLSYIGYGGNSACYCCFGLPYTFKKDNEEWFTDYKWVMINNDRRTLIRIPEGRK